MNRLKVMLTLALVALISSCTALTDCECSVKDEKTNKVTTFDEYDHDGSCSDFDEKDVTCTAK